MSCGKQFIFIPKGWLSVFYSLFSTSPPVYLRSKRFQEKKGWQAKSKWLCVSLFFISTFHFSRATLLSVPERKRNVIFSHHLCSIEYYQSEMNSSGNPAIFSSFALRNDNFFLFIPSITIIFIFWSLCTSICRSKSSFAIFIFSKSLNFFSKRIYIPMIFSRRCFKR